MSRYPKDSNAPAVIVLTRFLLVTLILGTLARLATKWWKYGSLFRDDYYTILATLASIAQAVAISIAVNNGYGSPTVRLDDGQIAHILKSQYAATIFYILGISLSQLSFLCFVQNLASKSWRFTALQITIAALTIVGVFGSAFQCHPEQWDYIHDRCFNREAWYIYVAASMILAEVAIIAQAVVMMINVQTTWRRKSKLMSVFLFRVFVPATLLAQIILIHRNINTPSPTSSTWSITVCMQLSLALSVVTASTPQFVPVLRQLQSTGMKLDGLSRYTVTSSNNPDSRNRYFLSGRRTGGAGESGHELEDIPLAATTTTVVGGAQYQSGHSRDGSEEGDGDGDGSRLSATGTGVIRETRTFVVTGERVDERR
ncbi:hypothetical protein BDV19DRAFT_359317 [Aspergillus venezuelensis]